MTVGARPGDEGRVAAPREVQSHTIATMNQDPLCAILRRHIQKQAAFPPVEVRKKHYHADGELQTEMDEITDQLFQEAKAETEVRNANALFNAILKQQLSRIDSEGADGQLEDGRV